MPLPGLTTRVAAVAAAWFLAGVPPVVAQSFPVEVASCFETVRFEAPPRRALVNDVNMVQTMIDMGLADRFVGVSGIAGVEHLLVGAPEVITRLRQFAHRPSLETVLGETPDFMFAGWSYGFSAATGLTPETLAGFGIRTYVLRESCIRIGRREPAGIEMLYADILALGAIFGVRERAERMVAEFRRRIDAVSARVAPAPERPRVMYCAWCDSVASPLSVGAEGITAVIMTLAGGKNIFDDIPDSYVRVSWEEVAKRDPQWILISDHRVPPDRIVARLTSAPEIAHVEAVRKRQFVFLGYPEHAPSTRTIGAVEKVARAFHPELFE